MSPSANAAQHDAYAAEYDAQVQAYDCHVADVLFGLCYEFTRPDQRLLDAGIGSGLSARLFAQAGLEVYGMDFSPAMLDICRVKGIAIDLQQHDLWQLPWPYPTAHFDHVVCCGVLHFIPELDGIFAEARRILQPGGWFAFTTRDAPVPATPAQKYHQQQSGDFDVYSHAPAYLEALSQQHDFTRRKTQRCFVGEDVFTLWLLRMSL